MTAPADPASDEQIRVLAREILARGEYARWRDEPSLLARVLEELGEWFARLPSFLPDWFVAGWRIVRDWFARMFGLSPGGELSLERWLVGALLCALIVAALVLLARALRDAISPRAAAAGTAAQRDEQRRLFEESQRLAEAGRFLEAAHRAQRATLELLLKRRWLVLERSEPNRTLRRRLGESALPERDRGELLALLARLEEHWFRDRAEDRDLFEAWRALHQRLERTPARAESGGRA